MPNVGLKAYIWNRQPEETKVYREVWLEEILGGCALAREVYFKTAPWSAACPKRELKQSLVPPFLTDYSALAIEWRHLWRIQGAHPAHQGAWLFDGGALHPRLEYIVFTHGQRLDENGVRIIGQAKPPTLVNSVCHEFPQQRITTKLCRFHLTSRCNGQPRRKRALRPTDLSTPFVRPPAP